MTDLAALVERLRASAGGDALPLPEELARARYESGGGQVSLALDAAALPGGEARTVCITSARVAIVNAFLWPDPRLDAPVYAMEIVRFGARGVVGVVDLVALDGTTAADAARARLDAARAAYPSLRAAEDPPEWFAACRSGADLFVRPSAEEDLAALADAAARLWDDALALLAAAAPCADPARHAAAQRAYGDHHRAHSPGRPFLERGWGAAWAERFLGAVFGR